MQQTPAAPSETPLDEVPRYYCAGADRVLDRNTHRRACDYRSARYWGGDPDPRCPQCRRWYACREIKRAAGGAGGVKTLSSIAQQTVYVPTGIFGVDRVLGGGLVRASSIALWGPWGVGKTTLLVQIAVELARRNLSTLYALGEQNSDDLGKVAGRLELKSDLVKVVVERDVMKVRALMLRMRPFLTIADSVQSMLKDDVEGSEESVSQGEACANVISGFCKDYDTCSIMTNHVTKGGDMKGGSGIAHYVDTIALFDRVDVFDAKGFLDEDASKRRRVLSTPEKNRNGEVGVEEFFDMTAKGLQPATKPRRPGSAAPLILMEGGAPPDDDKPPRRRR